MNSKIEQPILMRAEIQRQICHWLRSLTQLQRMQLLLRSSAASLQCLFCYLTQLMEPWRIHHFCLHLLFWCWLLPCSLMGQFLVSWLRCTFINVFGTARSLTHDLVMKHDSGFTYTRAPYVFCVVLSTPPSLVTVISKAHHVTDRIRLSCEMVIAKHLQYAVPQELATSTTKVLRTSKTWHSNWNLLCCFC